MLRKPLPPYLQSPLVRSGGATATDPWGEWFAYIDAKVATARGADIIYGDGDFGMAGDGQFEHDGAMEDGSNVLISADAAFTDAIIGQPFAVGGCGAGQSCLEATCIDRDNDGNPILSAVNASGADRTGKTFQFGTDNTAKITAAKNQLVKGGSLILPAGYVLGSVNYFNQVSVNLFGAACGANNFTEQQVGTCLVPITASRPGIDLTGALLCKIGSLQLQTTLSPLLGGVGILAAPSTTKQSAALVFEDMGVNGGWSQAPFYGYGMGDSKMSRCGFRNTTGETFVLVLTRDNVYGVTTPNGTIATGNQNAGNLDAQASEFHDQRLDGAATLGGAIWLRGAGMGLSNRCLIDSSALTLGNIVAENVGGVGCSLSAHNNHFYTEGLNAPMHNLYTATSPASTLDIADFANTYTFHASGAKKGGNLAGFSFIQPATA